MSYARSPRSSAHDIGTRGMGVSLLSSELIVILAFLTESQEFSLTS